MAGLRDKVCCVIPVYNNAATLRDVVSRCLKQLDRVLVIDDGSTDCDPAELLAGLPVRLHRHERNLGKGAALLTALSLLKDDPALDYMLTLDADGQHYPEDIPLFFPFMEANDYSMLIGCRDFSGEHVPGASKFGRSFSNFWMKVETGIDVADCQSGFRAYPLRYVSRLHFLSRHFDFEAEVLARAGWGNLEFHDVPIRSFYPPATERVSHFKPFLDNFRLTLIHTHLVMLRMMPFPKKKLRRKPMDFSIFRPKELFLYLLKENSSNGGLAASAAVGSFLAVLPIFGFHMVVILYVTERLHLNKLMALAIQNLFMPPISPFLCIELGYYLRYGHFWTEVNWNTLVNEFHLRAFEWLLGSLILAPFWGVVMGVAVYFTAKGFRAFFGKEAEHV